MKLTMEISLSSMTSLSHAPLIADLYVPVSSGAEAL